ncbi:MAG: ABC transporter ATP-binding protein [Oscillospiraceae bacterium]
MERKKLIELRNVYKIYNQGGEKINALGGVDIDIFSGEFVAIVGSSGSGKSTLMNMLGCLDLPSDGSYSLDGVDVLKLSDKALSKIRNEKIGFIFQGFNLISGLTAFENVELPLIYRGLSQKQRQERSLKALEKVSLGNRLSHRPSEMSGGQQQRVAIARALAADPQIILADEPTGNLDSRSGGEVMRILHALNNLGKTIILITHDMKIAETAERVIKIADGLVAG